MDEYDVFLDEDSREMTLDLTQKFALMSENCGSQMFVITPHSLRHVVTNDQVRIQRLVIN